MIMFIKLYYPKKVTSFVEVSRVAHDNHNMHTLVYSIRTVRYADILVVKRSKGVATQVN